ncbi:MAG: glycine--tRNA ligase [Candidatus Woesearchaeota archaeon]|jgi:glycyl-tRNA synthetase|nr:glycine--tRNA ligase [Candidatus Woesearchaeota archaeon]
MADKISILDMATFCKKKGLVYPSGEIYGGLAGFWDFGPLGVEFKNNIKKEWWKFHVQSREDIVGIDGSIITNPNVWKASGHIDNFSDVYVRCKECKKDNKLDKNEIGKVKCECGGEYDVVGDLNLMFKTNVGPVEGNVSYLRPETAQLMFADFRLVAENARMKLPFGIAQIGKAFRNEISPRDFLFRSREFEQMEIEYFVHPDKIKKCPYIKDVLDYEINVLSAELQKKDKDAVKMTMKKALEKKIIKTEWHAYWLATEHKWFVDLGANPDNFRIRQHVAEELSHYALDTWDLDYKFPFGWKELQGMANRTDFDLQQHIKVSKTDLSLFDNDSNKKVVPHVVAEPSQGVERAMLVFLFDAYNYDKKRGNIVLKLHSKLAPVKIGIFPLATKLKDNGRKIYDLLKNDFMCQFDTAGSVGKRYARSDEIGIPFCVTFDFDSLKDKQVTIRSRDTTKQIRVKIKELKDILRKLLDGEKLEGFGKIITSKSS